MPLFTYKARDTKGVVIEETIQASNKEDAVLTIRRNGYEVLVISGLEGGTKKFFSRNISVSEKATFARFLATMIRSGMSLPEAVEMLKQENSNPRMKKILTDVAYQTQKGQS
ncbi:MAG: Pilin biogenesis protein, partial [Candidatus Woesebacteria bacterium GW2011_GWC1_42_9]